MPELIDYDDDRGDTAAQTWLRSPVGKVILQNMIATPEAMLRQAYRDGYWRGAEAKEAAVAKGGEEVA